MEAVARVAAKEAAAKEAAERAAAATEAAAVGLAGETQEESSEGTREEAMEGVTEMAGAAGEGVTEGTKEEAADGVTERAGAVEGEAVEGGAATPAVTPTPTDLATTVVVCASRYVKGWLLRHADASGMFELEVPHISTYPYMVVSRCRGIGPPSGISSSGLCFCWLPIYVVIQLQTSFPAPFPCVLL